MLKNKFLIIIAIFLITNLNGMHSASSSSYENNPIYKIIAQEKEWLNIKPLTEKDLAGRAILLDFWTRGCSSCHQLMPKVHKLQDKFGDKLLIIGVHSANFDSEKDLDGIRSKVLEFDITYPVVNDKDLKLWDFFKVNAWPTLILINPNGKINANSPEYFPTDEGIELLTRNIETVTKFSNLNSSSLPIKLEKEKAPESFLKFPTKLIYVENFYGAPALFISDSGKNKVIGSRLSGEVFIEIGSGDKGNKDGNFETALFTQPKGLLYRDSILYVADTGNHLLRKIDFNSNTVTTIAGTGNLANFNEPPMEADALSTELASPRDLAFYPTPNKITIAMGGANQLWNYNIDNQKISVIAGNDQESKLDGPYPGNTLAQPSGLSVVGDKLYFVDAESSSLRVLENGIISTLIGIERHAPGYSDYIEGSKQTGRLNHPAGLFADPDFIYIADEYNNAIRRYDITNRILKNYSGNGKKGATVGKLDETLYNEPQAIVKGGNFFYIADTNNHRILKLDPEAGIVSVLNITPAKAQEVGASSTASSSSTALKVKAKKLNEAMKKNQIDFTVAASHPIKIDFLPTDAHLNEEAPSYFALFDNTKSDAPVNIKEYSREDLVSGYIMLPKLSQDNHYILQGIIMLCGEGCMQKKYSIGIIPKLDNKINSIDVNKL